VLSVLLANLLHSPTTFLSFDPVLVVSQSHLLKKGFIYCLCVSVLWKRMTGDRMEEEEEFFLSFAGRF